ncbi:MAG: 50S ribosomal protein L9 [Bacteroidales bacterium]|nr:50S ribosomal protein L9 [Bacteroidales bacterium]MDD6494482.1 50S ribosomal protein L9 [Bacteroidales bacterium]MDY4927361.1 50S ribosomal protein L9 [Prevotella sp.]
MQIILKEDIIGLGYKNDIVEVKSGYGRNYLIPQGKAVIASESAKKILAENLKQQAHKIAAILAAAQKEAEALNGVTVNIASKVSATGVLYGSVNAAQVAAELANKGITIDRKRIIMKDIKTVGEYVATVVFHKEVKVELPVVVTAENAQPAAVEETAEVAVEAAPVEEAPVVEAEAPVAE